MKTMDNGNNLKPGKLGGRKASDDLTQQKLNVI